MIQLKRAPYGDALNAYIPPAGQAVYDSTNNRLKIGNGTNSFAALPAIGGAWDGGVINNSATIVADGASDLKYWGIQYIDDTGATQHFRMNANNSSEYLSLTSSDDRIGTIISIKYDGTSAQFRGNAETANTLSVSRNISLSGAVIGSVGFNGASDIVINTSPGSTLLTTSSSAQAKNGNLYVLLGSNESGQRNLGVQFYKDNTLTQLYLMYNSSTNYSALYHSEYGSVISVDEANGTMNFNGSAESSWKLSTNRTISLTGAVTGSVSTDLSGNVSISTTANHNHSTSNITSGILSGTRGGTGNDNNTTNTIIVNNRAICYGSFSTGRYSANVAYGNHFYGNVAVDVKWSVTFTSAPIVLLTVLGATEGVLNIEVGSRSTTGMTSIRVHRTDAVIDIDPFNVSYIACGPTSST